MNKFRNIETALESLRNTGVRELADNPTMMKMHFLIIEETLVEIRQILSDHTLADISDPLIPQLPDGVTLKP